MHKARNRYLCAALAGLTVILLIVVLVNRVTSRSGPPIAVAYVDGQTLQFACLTEGRCPSAVDLGPNGVGPRGTGAYALSAFYLHPSSITVILSIRDPAVPYAILNINPKTSQIAYRPLTFDITP